MRAVVSAVAASIVLVVVAGCGVLSDPYTDQQRTGGVSPGTAEEAILEIEGVSDAEYGTYEWYSPGEGGLFSSAGMDVVLTVTIDPDYSVGDHDALLEYLAATAWSVNDHYPKGTVTIQLVGGEDPNFDWLSVAREQFDGLNDFWRARSAPYRDLPEWDRGGTYITIGAELYGQRFGRWPSDAVDAPEGMLANTPFEPIVLPAITDLTLVTADVGEQHCYRLDFVRSGTSAIYGGNVTTTLISAEGDELETKVGESNQPREYFCFEPGEFPEGARVHVVSGEYAGYDFAPVDETVELSDN
jgi:hypothetical protein